MALHLLMKIPTPQRQVGAAIPPGEPVDFARLCQDARVKPRVSGGYPAVVHLIEGSRLFKGTTPDSRDFYGIGRDYLRGLTHDDPELRAQVILNLLAYAFFDYPARETLSAARRRARSISYLA